MGVTEQVTRRRKRPCAAAVPLDDLALIPPAPRDATPAAAKKPRQVEEPEAAEATEEPAGGPAERAIVALAKIGAVSVMSYKELNQEAQRIRQHNDSLLREARSLVEEIRSLRASISQDIRNCSGRRLCEVSTSQSVNDLRKL